MGGIETSPRGESLGVRLSPELSKPIRLTRTFFAMSLIIVALVLTVQGWLYADWLQSDILENSKNSAVKVARHIQVQVSKNFHKTQSQKPRFEAHHSAQSPESNDAGMDDFDPSLIDVNQEPASGTFGILSEGEIQELDALVREAISGQDIVNVYIFDSKRHIVFSTQSSDIGFDLKENKHYDQALQGIENSVLVERGSPVDISQRRFGVVLLETYVPIRQESGEIIGVIEIYQDASEIKKVVQRGLLHIGLTSVLGFSLLTLALWFIVRGAHRHLDVRTAALIETNKDLAQLSQSLDEQVQERGRQLSRAETLASVGTLAAGVAHEINNPIATIASCAEGLLRKQEKGQKATESKESQYLELIRDEAYRVKGITRNLLDFSRPSSNEQSVVDVQSILQATLKILEFRARKLEISLELQPFSEETPILGDSTALRQLFLNVTINALDASKSGQTIRWSLSSEKGVLIVECQDEGAGIDSQSVEKVFEPFFTTKDPGKGTGLGLSISRTIVEQHKGELDIVSAPKQGTLVRIIFPLVHSPLKDTRGAAVG